jgi:hypothetical protein
VLANAMIYQARLGLRYVALKDRLGVIAARGSGGAENVGGDTAAAPEERSEGLR